MKKKIISIKNNHAVKGVLFPLIAAFIWGSAFTAQSICAKFINAFSMNAVRSIFAAVVLSLLCFILRKKEEMGKFSDIVKGSVICGMLLFAAANLQQLGLQYGTDSGKAGFITALYVVMLPFLRLLKKEKSAPRIWVAIVIAMVGLYFLCVKGSFSFRQSDVYLMVSAFFYALQIMALDSYTDKVYPIALSSGQFLVMGTLSFAASWIFEGGFDASGVVYCLPEVIYMAVFSSCIAYTLQVVSLQDGNPVVVSILYSLESVFAVITGAIVLGEKLSTRELFGCGLMFVGVLLAEIPVGKTFGKIRRRIRRQ